jgi:hypothetical protein
MKRKKSNPRTKPMHPVIQGFVKTLSRSLPKARGVPIERPKERQ